VTLTNKGEIIKGILAEDSRISRPGWPETGVLFKAGTLIEFYEDGSPKTGTLAEDGKFIRFGTMNKRIVFAQNTVVELDPASLAIKGTLAGDEVLVNSQGIQKIFKKGDEVRFDSKGFVIEN
jgi:hypothetical protein